MPRKKLRFITREVVEWALVHETEYRNLKMCTGDKLHAAAAAAAAAGGGACTLAQALTQSPEIFLALLLVMSAGGV